MQPIRVILEDAPESLLIPAELRHHRVEIIFWPLEEVKVEKSLPIMEETPRQVLARVLARPPRFTLNALSIETKGFHFNREEVNER
jgi:hypothetical protein